MASVTLKFRDNEFTISANEAEELTHFLHRVWYAAYEGKNMAVIEERFATAKDHKELADAITEVWDVTEQ